jgi:hypothetical protein
MSRKPSGAGAGRPGSFRRLAREIFAIDLRSLAALRVAVATLLMVDLHLRARHLSALYTDQGILPRAFSGDSRGMLPSLHALGGSVGFEAALFALAAGSAAALLVGWHTRIFTFLSWLLLDSLQRRNFMVLGMGDDLMKVVLFWSLFLPLGARFSIDSRRAGSASPGNVSSPASAALLLQVAFVYFFSGWMKTGPEWTADGSAISYALGHDYWARPLARVTGGFPEVLRALTPLVLWFERLGPLFLFSPFANARLRIVFVLAFCFFMLGLGVHIDLGLIPWASAVAMLPFLPGTVWDHLARALALAPGVQPPVPRRPRGARILDAGLVLAIGLVVWANLGTLDARLAPPDALRRLASALQLQQSWFMYAPSPPRTNYWIELRGWLSDGATVDLLAPGDDAGAAWKSVVEHHRDHRFRAHLERLVMRKWPERARDYASWLCRQWNADATARKRLTRVAVVAGFARIDLAGGISQPRRQPLTDQSCSPPTGGDRTEG